MSESTTEAMLKTFVEQHRHYEGRKFFLGKVRRETRRLLKRETRKEKSRLLRDVLGLCTFLDELIRADAPASEVAWESFNLAYAILIADARIAWKLKESGSKSALTIAGFKNIDDKRAAYVAEKLRVDELVYKEKCSEKKAIEDVAASLGIWGRSLRRHFKWLEEN